MVAVLPSAGQTRSVTGEQLELISSDPQVMHGQAVLARTRVPVSVILDCLAAGMTVEGHSGRHGSHSWARGPGRCRRFP